MALEEAGRERQRDRLQDRIEMVVERRLDPWDSLDTIAIDQPRDGAPGHLESKARDWRLLCPLHPLLHLSEWTKRVLCRERTVDVRAIRPDSRGTPE